MLQPEAILRFADQQKRLLRQTYDGSWQQGVDSYKPDQNPKSEPSISRAEAVTGLAALAALAVLRQYKYAPPQNPDAMRRALALAPAFRGVNRMVGELSTLGGTPVADWVASNGARLLAGESVAWAGEQAGFGEAANADGMAIYQWMSAADPRVCSDCELLSSFPPAPLSEWPTVPGAGDTECNVGCRCSWEIWDTPLPANYVPQLTDEQQTLSSQLADRQLNDMSDLMSDAGYL